MGHNMSSWINLRHVVVPHTRNGPNPAAIMKTNIMESAH